MAKRTTKTKHPLSDLPIEERFADFLTFSKGLLRTRDLDPIYDLTRDVAAREGLTREQLLWFLALYGYAYNTATAWFLFNQFPDPASFNAEAFTEIESANRAVLTVNIERRGLRGGKITQAVAAYVETLRGGDQETWLRAGMNGNPESSYLTLWSRVQQLPFVGPWAAVKMLDLYQWVADFPVRAPDMRIAGRHGPKEGLQLLFWGPDIHIEDVATLDAAALTLQAWMLEAGVEGAADLSVVETCCCKFHGTWGGHYYVGHDIDEHLHSATVFPGDQRTWTTARRRVLPLEVRGEDRGWPGLRTDLRGAYKRGRVIHCDMPE